MSLPSVGYRVKTPRKRFCNKCAAKLTGSGRVKKYFYRRQVAFFNQETFFACHE
jgi:hypothetical protein